jgi:curli biogenesis system outer membrane secretion channel CsgG
MTSFTPEDTIPDRLDMSYAGPKANIAIGDFTVKARGATVYIGDGLREMLETALFESRRFNVLDRLDPKGITAEQSLSYSKMAKPGSPKLGRKMGVAEILIYGTVTEFEAQTSGGGIKAEMPGVPATASAEGKNAHMAIDIRVVDAASGLVVAARRIAGSAASGKGLVGTTLGGGSSEMPISLGGYKNTAMELAIRDCIYRSVIYASHAVPMDYFRH